jgi:undecaprenyl-diphosphatase
VLASIDDRLVEWVVAHRWPPLNDPLVWLGDLDRLGAIWVLLAIVIGAVHRCGVLRTLGLAVLTEATTFAADSASFGVKSIVDRARPFEAHPQIHPLYTVHSTSFPAGHAATSFAAATLLSALAPRAMPLFVAFAASIALSRVYVGVHYPGDVLGGAAIGVTVGLVAIALRGFVSERLERRRRRAEGRRRAAHARDARPGPAGG